MKQSAENSDINSMPSVSPTRLLNGIFGRLKDRPHPTWLVLCAPIVCNIGFGLYPVVVRVFASGEGEKANSFIFTLYRGTFATPVLFLLSYYCEGRIPLPDIKATLTFMVLALFGVFIGQTAYIAGVYLVGPDISSAMQPLIAIWTALISILCCVEKVPSLRMCHTYAKVFGVIISIGGVANIFSGNPPGVDKGRQVLGFSALLLDTFCGGVWVTLMKKLIFNQQDCVWKNYPVGSMAYIYLFGSIYQGVANLYFVVTGQAHLFLIPQHAFPALVYAVFITSTFCYSLISWANKFLPPSIVTAFWPVQPVTTVFTAYFILGEELTFQQCVGVVFILAGLSLVLYSNHMDERMAKEASVSGNNNMKNSS